MRNSGIPLSLGASTKRRGERKGKGGGVFLLPSAVDDREIERINLSQSLVYKGKENDCKIEKDISVLFIFIFFLIHQNKSNLDLFRTYKSNKHNNIS